MAFKILYITATETEADSLKQLTGIISVPGGYRSGEIEITPLISGIGSISMAWAMKQWLSVNNKPDLVINAGIAGSYNEELPVGSVVMPVSDCFADYGIEDGNNFLTLSEAHLSSADEFPFVGGLLLSDPEYNVLMKNILKPVKAITVNTSTGSEATRNKLSEKFNPDIETMEGATFFYICAREKLTFLALRAISNMVEPRNRSNWNILLALDKLTEKLKEVIKTL